MATPIDPDRNERLTDLFRRWRDEGDKPAQGELYSLLEEEMFIWANRVLNNVADAEVCVTKVFGEIAGKAQQFDPARGSFLGWVKMVVTCRARDLLRHRQGGMGVDLGPDDHGDDGPTPSSEASRDEVAEAVRDALEWLRTTHPDLARPLVLQQEGRTLAEIGKLTGTLPATVGTRIFRAKEYLRGRLLAHDPNAGPDD